MSEMTKNAAIDWILERLSIGPAYRFPLALGVARACGLWDDEEECYTVPESIVEARTEEALTELVTTGAVRAMDDSRGQGPRYELVRLGSGVSP